MGPKRKGDIGTDGEKPHKKPHKTKGKAKANPEALWPEYFQSLFKIYKALNTVLAFVTSRKNIATTFSVVRASVEALLKQPLQLSQVAELKALLPDQIKFAYIPTNDHRINASVQERIKRPESPDFSAFSQPNAPLHDPDEQVLVLEFAENARGTTSANPGFPYSAPPSLTPAAVQRLIDRRNERFCRAVEELLSATPETDDPVALLQSAGHDHIPVDPKFRPASPGAFAEAPGKGMGPVPDSKNRPSIDSVIQEIQEAEWYKDQIVERKVFEAKEGQLASLHPPLSATILQALQNSRKITSLYTHQVAAISALSSGKHVIVSTSTASGKSVIYQVPLLRFLEENSAATAMFIYPTKALAQDQKAALEQLLVSCPGLEHIKVATYDGDTLQEKRAGIRETASVIFTNFDMIHTSILPHEDLWRRFLKNLKLVAVDELHYYSDLFGSHVAQVMRRFRRVCAAIGNRRSLFVSCSATISKPAKHMKKIFGVEDIVEITEDGAPSGRKEFLVWNPPLRDAMDPSLGRHFPLPEATGLMRFLMKRGVRVILFCKVKIRKVCELAMKAIRAELSADGRLDILDRVMSYRGGYSQEDRRRIEHKAFSGNLLGIIATNALELGVDIGVLDAVLMLGFPINIASFRQQSGRAGRRARDSLSVFVADLLPVDQYYVQNPQELFDKATDDLMVDLENEIILEAHLQCASHEMPLCVDDEAYFGPLMRGVCDSRLLKDKDGWYQTHPKFLPFPAKFVAIRGAEEEKFTIVDITKIAEPGERSRIIEEIEISRALFEIYEGAVFINQGLTHIVKEISHDTKLVKVIRADVSWITKPRDFTDIDAVQTYRIREIKSSPQHAYYGRVEVRTKVYGYFKIRGKHILDAVDLENQPWERETTGMWIDVPPQMLDLMREKEINAAAAIHSAEHAFLKQFALARELKTECKLAIKEYKTAKSERKRPARLIFYDIVGKGGGIAAKAFDIVSQILRNALEAIEKCQCEEGCLECVQSTSCRAGNIVASKIGAEVVLRAILGLPVEVDQIPFCGDEGSETIVEAESVRLAGVVEVEKA